MICNWWPNCFLSEECLETYILTQVLDLSAPMVESFIYGADTFFSQEPFTTSLRYDLPSFSNLWQGGYVNTSYLYDVKYIIFDRRASLNISDPNSQNRIIQNYFRLSHLSPWASQDTSGFIATNKGSVTAIMSAISFWKENVIYVLFVNPLTLLLQLQLLASKFKLVECSLKGFLLFSELKIFDSCVRTNSKNPGLQFELNLQRRCWII